MHILRIIVRLLPGPTIFSRIFSQTARFSKKVAEHKICVLIFSINFSETFLILRRTERDMIQNVQGEHKFNPLNPELNPICYLLALLGAHHFLHISRIRVKLLTFRLLISCIYGAPILDVSRSHTTTQHSR